jgi:hypothetical protein
MSVRTTLSAQRLRVGKMPMGQNKKLTDAFSRISDAYFAVDPVARNLLLGDLEAQRLIRIGRRYGTVYALTGVVGVQLIFLSVVYGAIEFFSSTMSFFYPEIIFAIGACLLVLRAFVKRSVRSIYAELHHYADSLALLNESEVDPARFVERERMIDGLRWVNLEP